MEETMDSKRAGPSSSTPAAGTPAAEDERNKWHEAAFNAAQDLHDFTMLWEKTRDAVDVATNENLRALAYSIAQRNVAERLAKMGMGAEAPAAVAEAVAQVDQVSLGHHEKDHDEPQEPMEHENSMRGRSYREDRRGRARRRSPPRETSSFSGNSLSDDEGSRDETSTALTRREGIGDEDAEGEGELILTGFDINKTMGLEDHVVLKEQLRWLHDLAARQERMLDELHGESVRMLENNHRLAMRVIHQEKELEEMTEAYSLALEYTPTERITDGSESYSTNASSTRRDGPLLLKDDEHRQHPLAITDGKQADDVQAEGAAVAPEMNHVTVSANGDIPGHFDAVASAPSGPSAFPDAPWTENPSDMPSVSSMAVVGGYSEMKGQGYPDVGGSSGKVELNGNGYHDLPGFGTQLGEAEIFDPSLGSLGRENGSNPGGRVGAGAGAEHSSTNSWPHEREVLFEPPTETVVGGNGAAGQYPWDVQQGNGSVDAGGTGSQEEVGRAAVEEDVSSFDTSPAMSASPLASAPISISAHGMEPATNNDVFKQAPLAAAAGEDVEEVREESAGIEPRVADDGQSRSQGPGDKSESQAEAEAAAAGSSLPPPPILPLPHPGQPMSSLRRPPPYAPVLGAPYGAVPRANPFGGSSHTSRHVSKNSKALNGSNPEVQSGSVTGLGGVKDGGTGYENGPITDGVAGGTQGGVDYTAPSSHPNALGIGGGDQSRVEDTTDATPAKTANPGVPKEGGTQMFGKDGDMTLGNEGDAVMGRGVHGREQGGDTNKGEGGSGNGPGLAGGAFGAYSDDPWAGTGVGGMGGGAGGGDDLFASGV